MRKKSLTTIIFMMSFLFACPSYSFDNKQTHPDVTELAVDNSELNNFLINQLHIANVDEELDIGDGKPTSIKELMRKGSKEEDEPACRASSHFHNPLLPWEQAGLTDPLWLIDKWCSITSPFREKYSNLVWATGMSAPNTPMTDPPNSDLDTANGRNWLVARTLFHSALTEQNPQLRNATLADTFKTIGYVLHLLQDMAVPAHTRNDFSQGHTKIIGCPENGECEKLDWVGNPFEGYVRDNFDEIDAEISEISLPYTGTKTLTNFWDTTDTYDPTHPIPTASFTQGLAEYSNGNFVSTATKKFDDESDTEHYFRYPSRASIADQDYPDRINQKLYNVLAKDGKLDKGVYVSKERHGEIVKNFLAPRYVFFGADWNSEDADRYDLKFFLDDECHKDYAKKLIPRAVGYSAGLIDYFFRGTIEITPPEQFAYAVIDGSVIDPDINSQIFPSIKMNLRNTTSNSEIMGQGQLYAVAKYKRRTDYLPDMSANEPPTQGSREDDFSYSVSIPEHITGLASDTPQQFTFVFPDGEEIPAGITDLTLQVVFRGTLGQEQDIAVAVGFIDLAEPMHFCTSNSSDRYYLDQVLYTKDEILASQELIDRLADGATSVGNRDYVLGQIDVSVDITQDFNMNEIWPHPISKWLSFYAPGGSVTSVSTDVYYESIPASSYGRVIALVGEPGHVASTSQSEFAYQTWSFAYPMVVNQEDFNGIWHTTDPVTFRGITAHTWASYARFNGPMTGIGQAPWPPIFNPESVSPDFIVH